MIEVVKTETDTTDTGFVRASDEKSKTEDEEEAKPKKQHKGWYLALLLLLNSCLGLRCIKCFALLCRDNDFEYVNGKLWVNNDELRKSGWQGLETRGSWVCCSFYLYINALNIFV